MFLFNALIAGLGAATPEAAGPAAQAASDSSRPVPASAPAGNSSASIPLAASVAQGDSLGNRGAAGDTSSLLGDSAGVRKDSLATRTWTVRLGGSVGVQFPSFSQRSRFRTDIASVVERDSLRLQQGLQASELAPLLGLELSLQWRQAVRLVAEGQWSTWWNDARAAGDGRQRDWSLAVQVWRAGLGPDLIVPTQVFSIQGMGPLVIESRAWVVKSSLESQGYSEGWGSGWSVGLASSLRTSRHFEMGGRVRWHQEEVQGGGDWGQLLETGGSGRPRWATGGLALGLWSTFDAGW